VFAKPVQIATLNNKAMWACRAVTAVSKTYLTSQHAYCSRINL